MILHTDFSEYGRPRLARFLYWLLPKRLTDWLEPTEDDLVRWQLQAQAEQARQEIRAQLEAEARAALGMEQQ